MTAVLVEHALSHATREEEVHRMHTKDICMGCCFFSVKVCENMFDQKGFPLQTNMHLGLVDLFSIIVLCCLFFCIFCHDLPDIAVVVAGNIQAKPIVFACICIICLALEVTAFRGGNHKNHSRHEDLQCTMLNETAACCSEFCCWTPQHPVNFQSTAGFHGSPSLAVFGRQVRTQIDDVFKICWHHAPLSVKEKIKAALPELQTIFTSLDADGSGHVTRAEAANVPLTVSYLQQICLAFSCWMIAFKIKIPQDSVRPRRYGTFVNNVQRCSKENLPLTMLTSVFDTE